MLNSAYLERFLHVRKARVSIPQSRCALMTVFLAFAASAGAQGTVPDGEYAAVFKGKVHYTDRQPAEQQIVEQATLRISSSGNAITIEVGQIGSAMSATRFRGTSGNAKFVAMQSVPGKENQAKLLWGNVQSRNTLRGTLLYPRVAGGLVPGFTELEFEAKVSSTASTHSRTPRDRMPSSSSSSDLKSRFPARTLPSADTSSSNAKPDKELKPRQPTAASGSSVISGTVTGDINLVKRVELFDENEVEIQSMPLDRNGRYRFESLGPGRYGIYIYDKGGDPWITTTTGERVVEVDGRSSYRIDFTVKDRSGGSRTDGVSRNQ